ncbi:MAG: twin-arginine translocation signal domain-containing protein [Nanoarchaeota archaeon]|nr:twin-arginine translocation signal domain-containing protein [Nanoarchaeota archaeon]
MHSRREFLEKVAIIAGVAVASGIPFVKNAHADYESVIQLNGRLQHKKSDALEYATERGYTSFLSSGSGNETPWGNFEAGKYSLRQQLSNQIVGDMFTDRRFRVEAYTLNKLIHDNVLAESRITLPDLFDKSVRLAGVMDSKPYSFTYDGVTYGVTDREKRLIRARLGERMRFGALSNMMDSAITLMDTAVFLDNPMGKRVVSLKKEKGQEEAHNFINSVEEILNPENNEYVKLFNASFEAFDFAAVNKQIIESRRVKFMGADKNGLIDSDDMSMEQMRIKNLVLSLETEPIHDASRENELFMYWYNLARKEDNLLLRDVLANKALPYGRRVMLLSDDFNQKEMAKALITTLDGMVSE